MKVKINKKELPKEGRSTLNKAVKNVKKRLETKNKEARVKKVSKINKRKNKNRDQVDLNRGIVYIGHIPHGFYEDQMKEYFKQFGRVVRVRLARSKETGKSRGYGYVEFLNPEVAKIAAETMNNYLMCGRLLKATCIPPEKQHNGFFTKTRWTKEHYPKKFSRMKEIKKLNAVVTKEKHEIFVKKSHAKLTKISNKLEKQGIELNFPISPKKE
ncbi:MKI67 FHA domain-interacting nucleolar phosphoprotein [Venturia canescens]|uniref:MKI67 FHA domain-interacting nucleolar phosphoprotein n=1 Tax=Venturia canescens TaxID=32260 RepID=UPI001C9C4BA4|nr:MKI67 FHA domain-interacting nucleolar phosphoprotein-like [Venturia canescens]